VWWVCRSVIFAMPNTPCSECGKVIAGSPYNLEEHLRTHTGKRPFQCTGTCGKFFKRKSHLTSHLALKACIRKPRKIGHHCSQCNVFIKGSPFNLRLHERTHSGFKPFQCDECEDKFLSQSALRSHKLTHSGLKPNKCDECGVSFSQPSALKSHKRRHRGEKPFKCDVDNCDAAFVDSGELAKHKERWHSKEGVQRKKKQEEAMKNALVLAGYTESFERGVVPYPGQFVREVYFDHRCALARDFMPGEKKYAYVDFVVRTRDGRLVFLEVDEEQHEHIPQLCETTRMWNICESIALADLGDDINVFWLRFNPNSGFHVAGRTLRTPREQRFKEVLKFLDDLKASPDDPPMQIGYAFYDCEANGKPLVLNDPEYHEDVLPAVVCISKGSQMLVQPCAFPKPSPLFAPIDWTQTIGELQGEAPGSDDEFEDVPSGEAGGSSGKRPRVA
jgi:hypothetical protein